MNFWLSGILLTLVIALICFYPLLKKSIRTSQSSQIKRDTLNKAFYLDRLQEIDHDVQQGLVEDAEQVKIELQKNLLEDIPPESAVSFENKSYGKLWFVSGFLSLLIIAGAIYFKIGAWQAQDMVAKTYEKLPYFYERVKDEDNNPLTDQELQQFATALRVKLQHEPADAKSWWLLGQVGMSLNKGNLAFDAYGKAAKLEPENTEYKLSYARILMMSDDSNEKMQGEELLKQVIRRDHTNMQALSLLAFYYFSKEDYKMAAVTWAMMLKLMPEDDARRDLIEKSIRSARDAIAEQAEEKKEK
ncbi:c-type cytochrome biogenesis protein CcmI [Actinobacillus succinogenes]|uniref:NrfG protein n=1 Tax=Actinobacillus succinogenes (strain ATCC 55618 / DSM 22257 / CCUG 43843 / 130Z) TaxID=339671 RepID=A6VMM4_ACTSZ|nr:c-type cytochrome biogenesis protein CcmI [Actinobacillus succinogenes]ABR74221.1 NrfG protein [Actinobacillus succinogenes 130Z]PHI39350.1 c-type cytochrome biogenesis protein CcmI [Actinobacillus succinogenes]